MHMLTWLILCLLRRIMVKNGPPCGSILRDMPIQKDMNVMTAGAIWKYRDWLIHAFNEDKPYDQFLDRTNSR